MGNRKASPAKYGKYKIDHLDDEREIGNGVIVMLKSGYKWPFDDHGVHVHGFDTMTEMREEVQAAIKCDCDKCK